MSSLPWRSFRRPSARWVPFTLVALMLGAAPGLAATSPSEDAPGAAVPALGSSVSYHLTWLQGQPSPVLSLDDGAWNNLGQLVTAGDAAYTCYSNASQSSGPGDLDLLTNASGHWQAIPAGPNPSSISGALGATCAVTLTSWNGHAVVFIAFLSDQSTPSGDFTSVELVYDPGGNVEGPWVNVSVFPPDPASATAPDGPSITIWDHQEVVVAFDYAGPAVPDTADPNVYVRSLMLSALPTTVGGQPTQPWGTQIPTYADACGPYACAFASDALPVVNATSSGLTLAFQREGPWTATGAEGQMDYEVGVLEGTAEPTSGNTSWTTNGGNPQVLPGAPGAADLGLDMGLASSSDGTGAVLADEPVLSNGSATLNASVLSGGIWTTHRLGFIQAGGPGENQNIPGVTEDACGLSVGTDELGQGGGGVPTVWTFNNSAWTSSPFGPENNSIELPYFVDVAGQGSYLDTLFANQPRGGSFGPTIFYTDQAVCTDAGVASVSVVPSSVDLGFNASVVLQASATSTSGSPLYASEGIVFDWQLVPASLGLLNGSSSSATGPVIELSSGSTGGTGLLWVNVTDGGSGAFLDVPVTISRTAGGLGAPASTTDPIQDLLLGGALGAVLFFAVFLPWRYLRQRHARPTPRRHAPAGRSASRTGPRSGPSDLEDP